MLVLHWGRQVVAFLPQELARRRISGQFSVFSAEFVPISCHQHAKNMHSGHAAVVKGLPESS